MIVATEAEITSSVWLVPMGKSQLAHHITFNDEDQDGVQGLAWTPDRRLVFASHRSGSLDLWSIGADGSSLRQLTHGEGSNSNPAVSPDGRSIVFVSTRTGNQCIWKMDINGENPVQLTRDHEDLPSITADGKNVLYGSWMREGIFQLTLNGGPPVQLISDFAFRPLASPDGKLLAVMKYHPDQPAYYLDVFPFGGGPP